MSFNSSLLAKPVRALRRLSRIWVRSGSRAETASKSPRQRSRQLEQLQNRLGYSFKNVLLLDHALTHRSFAHESGNPGADYETMEFLGDSVVGLVISEHLFQLLRPENQIS